MQHYGERPFPQKEIKMANDGRKKLDQAYNKLEHEVPEKVAQKIQWLRSDNAKWVRIPMAIVLMIAGCFGFLPVIGIELIPLGLMLIAQDIPFLRKPVAKLIMWLVHKWVMLRQWWEKKHPHTPGHK